MAAELIPTQPSALKANARCDRAQVTGKRRQEQKLHGVAQAENKPPLGVTGVKMLPSINAVLQCAQRSLHVVGYAVCEGGWRDLAAAAHEQWVVEVLTQAGEGIADGGLAQMQVASRFGQRARAVDGVKNAEQIQVHWLLSGRKIYSLYE